ncbi:MAG: hypothetical protein ACR2HJ_03915 [Fimbriimonadales bacterium]
MRILLLAATSAAVSSPTSTASVHLPVRSDAQRNASGINGRHVDGGLDSVAVFEWRVPAAMVISGMM